MVQLSHPYITTGKPIALTIWTFVNNVMSLLVPIMLSRFIIAFLPKSKILLISWLQSPSAVILKPPKIKSVTVSIVFPSICHEVMGLAVSNSLQAHGLQYTRPPCPSPAPKAYSNSCPLSQWCHPTISSSVVPFSIPPIFPNIRIFSSESALHIRWPKSWSFSFSISPSNEHSGLPLGWTGWISLQSKGLSRVFSNTTGQKHQFFGTQLSL